MQPDGTWHGSIRGPRHPRHRRRRRPSTAAPRPTACELHGRHLLPVDRRRRGADLASTPTPPALPPAVDHRRPRPPTSSTARPCTSPAPASWPTPPSASSQCASSTDQSAPAPAAPTSTPTRRATSTPSLPVRTRLWAGEILDCRDAVDRLLGAGHQLRGLRPAPGRSRSRSTRTARCCRRRRSSPPRRPTWSTARSSTLSGSEHHQPVRPDHRRSDQRRASRRQVGAAGPTPPAGFRAASARPRRPPPTQAVGRGVQRADRPVRHGRRVRLRRLRPRELLGRRGRQRRQPHRHGAGVGRVPQPSTDRTIDCRTAVNKCSLLPVRQRRPADLGRRPPSTSIPNGPLAPPPTITVTPTTGLVDGQELHVVGDGFPANALIALHQCQADQTGLDGCDTDLFGSVVADAQGHIDMITTAKQIIGLGTDGDPYSTTFDCGSAPERLPTALRRLQAGDRLAVGDAELRHRRRPTGRHPADPGRRATAVHRLTTRPTGRPAGTALVA